MGNKICIVTGASRGMGRGPQMLMKFADLNYEYLMSWDYFDDD